jgi:hypothetical protein
MTPYILIIWLVSSGGAATGDGNIHSVRFEREEACLSALANVKRQSRGRIDGVCNSLHYAQ